MHKTRKYNRKLRNFFKFFFNILRFKTQNFWNTKKIFFVWLIVSFISLFLDWIISEKNQLLTSNAFNDITWLNAVLIIINILILIFILLSTNKKEKLKLSSNLYFKDHMIIAVSSSIIFVLSISSLYSIIWLKTFFSDISYGNWVILSISSSIIILISGLSMRNEDKKNKTIYLNDYEIDKSSKISDDNMKLPF